MNVEFSGAQEFKEKLIGMLRSRGYCAEQVAVVNGHWCAKIIGYGWRRVSDCLKDNITQHRFAVDPLWFG
jgi:hypothetical protein